MILQLAYLEGCDGLFEDLSRVKRERLLGKSDLLVGILEPYLTVLITSYIPVFISDNWILNNCVMPRGHCDHLLRTENNPKIIEIICLLSVCKMAAENKFLPQISWLLLIGSVSISL